MKVFEITLMLTLNIINDFAQIESAKCDAHSTERRNW